MRTTLRALPIACISLVLTAAARAQDTVAPLVARVQAGDELPHNAPPNGVNGVSEVAHHAASPVPQFDPASFPGQLFWLIVTFALLYLAMSRLVLPRIGGVIGARAGHIAQDLAEAQDARATAGRLLAEHEAALKAARDSAQATVSAAQAAAARSQAEQLAAQGMTIAAAVTAAEARLAVAAQEAQAGLAAAVTDAAMAIAARLTGLTVDRASAETAARSVLTAALESKAA